ncbi:hypothetical protein B0T14DRAFT_152994 [Immersiella caudata]|uniref:Zn(2)-C6 fungal-type domain-containing protein n=1 Tax=Immersiella caudata TaxID=314043 RepID=A0AA40C3A4_9PEZI|nr:hypothetical protein B0T14DRAFT_152994 [Immersiella caudata]
MVPELAEYRPPTSLAPRIDYGSRPRMGTRTITANRGKVIQCGTDLSGIGSVQSPKPHGPSKPSSQTTKKLWTPTEVQNNCQTKVLSPRMPSDPKQPKRVTACDRCHSMKERCVYDLTSNTHSHPSCSRCTKLARPCTTSRQRPPVGRRRKPEAATIRPQPGQEFVWRTSSPPRHPPNQPPNFELHHQPTNHLLARRSSAEISLLHALFDKNRPTTEHNFMNCFILGPSFADAEIKGLATMLSAFPEATDALLSGMLACSGRFFALVGGPGPKGSVGEPIVVGKRLQEGEDLYRYSAKAVKELRERGGEMGNGRGGVMDLLLPMVLALGIITFDLLDSGMHAHGICRFALGLIGSSAEAVRADELDRHLLPLIHMDTLNCLVRRHIPLYRLRPVDVEGGVDRYIGRCVPLFSLLYEVCCVSWKLNTHANGRESMDEDYGELAKVEAAVRDWTPELSDEDVGAISLTPREIQVVNTQASVHKRAILLFLHRLRFPFGDEDDAAIYMAAPILDDIASLYPVQKGEQALVQFEYRLALPFLIAVAELQDPVQRTRALHLLDCIMWRRIYHNAARFLEGFISHIWESRDRGWKGHWVDLADDGPPFILF